MRFLSHLCEIIADYDALLLDLWGVMHDGTALYPGALGCLKELRKAGKKILFLSNAPRRAVKAQVVLDQLGVSRDLYDALLTSGEAGYALLNTKYKALGTRYFYIGPPKDESVLDGLGYEAVPLAEAEFVLNVGFGTEAQTDNHFDAELRESIRRGLPMLCLNPDMEVVKITGERYPCAGVIAKAYAQLGGQVEYIGKPHADVYAQAFAMLGNPDKSRVIGVGDGLHTDVLGAKNAGIASVYITGGILKQELREPAEEDVRAYLARSGIAPDYVMPALVY